MIKGLLILLDCWRRLWRRSVFMVAFGVLEYTLVAVDDVVVVVVVAGIQKWYLTMKLKIYK